LIRNTFTSASPDNIKQWYLPEAKFIQNLSAVVNTMACNADGVLVSGADNGSMSFWDHRTGYRFQQQETIVQPGSLDSEAGIFAMTFDKSGSRLITAEADKTIKIWKEDPESVRIRPPNSPVGLVFHAQPSLLIPMLGLSLAVVLRLTYALPT
jgi:pleiotropic regulator 1